MRARARVAHCKAALVADPAQRETLYADALREHEASSRPFERARTELAYGEFLRRTFEKAGLPPNDPRATIHAFTVEKFSG